MPWPLAGRRALVTGSAAGIGFAIACVLAQQGAALVVNGRHGPALALAVERLNQAMPGLDVGAVQADLGTPEGANHLAQAVGEVDILVNNPDIFERERLEQEQFEQITDDDGHGLFETIVMSGVRMTGALLPGMLSRGWGRVVFIARESGLNPPPDMAHYGLTKAAQSALARGLAETCAGTGVTVNSVLPGPTMAEGAAYFEAAARRQQITVDAAKRAFFAGARPSSLIRRFIEPAEVAALVAHLCSPLSGAIQGAALRVDGGVVLNMLQDELTRSDKHEEDQVCPDRAG
jgi:NAD(P)-dependent dehydrogenase (short-subunit alcohol dehydrogenase family)